MRDPLSCIVDSTLTIPVVIVGRHPRPARKLGRVVEGAALEMLLGGYPYESSNLSVSVAVVCECSDLQWGISLAEAIRAHNHTAPLYIPLKRAMMGCLRTP